jgi:hypothetical protein
MNNNHKTTLALFFAGWAAMCLACSGGGGPVECDEQCRKEQRRAGMPKDGDAVMAEGAAQPGTLRLPPSAPPEIVYPDGTKQDAGAVRIVKLPPAGGKR